MALQFNHKPQGSLIGGSGLQFRYYGDEEITDLTGTTWKLNLDAEWMEGEPLFHYIDYISNNKNFYRIYAPLSYYGFMYIYEDNGGICDCLYGRLIDSTNYGCYVDDEFVINNNYRTISITGGTDATNTTLINWLYANAVKQ